jgi:hypothetical protein
MRWTRVSSLATQGGGGGLWPQGMQCVWVRPSIDCTGASTERVGTWAVLWNSWSKPLFARESPGAIRTRTSEP